MNNTGKQTKLKLKTGDLVQVITGNDKGKKGRIRSINKERFRAVVEGINMRIFHRKRTQENPKGKREQSEGTIDISNLMLIEPNTKEMTRVGRRPDETGKLKRYAKKTGNLL